MEKSLPQDPNAQARELNRQRQIDIKNTNKETADVTPQALRSPRDYKRAFENLRSQDKVSREGLEEIGVSGLNRYILWLAFGYLLTFEPIGSFFALCYLDTHWYMSSRGSALFSKMVSWQKYTLVMANIIYIFIFLFLIVMGVIISCAIRQPTKTVFDIVFNNFPQGCF